MDFSNELNSYTDENILWDFFLWKGNKMGTSVGLMLFEGNEGRKVIQGVQAALKSMKLFLSLPETALPMLRF